MLIKEFEPSHYCSLKVFWESYGWNAPPLELLPKKGFVAIAKDQVIGAAFLYVSQEPMAFLDWVIADKDSSEFTRGKCVYKTVLACKNYAVSQGVKVIYTVTKNKALLASYERMGFSEMEKDATTMAMSLDGSELGFLR